MDKATVECMSHTGKHRKGFWQAAVVGGFTIGIAVGATATSVGFMSAEASPVDVQPVSIPAPHLQNTAERILLTERASRASDRQDARLKQERIERREARQERQAARQAAREAQAQPVPEPTPEPVVSYPTSGNRALGLDMMLARGWDRSQWPCLDELWARESGWNHLAENSSSGAYGIPQALPGSKMATAGGDWASNPATQIRWGLGYIAGRYGSPCDALGFHDANGWY